MNRNDAKLLTLVKVSSGSLHRIAWLVGLVAIGVSAESARAQVGACCVDIDDGPCAFDTCFETTPDGCDTQGGVFHGAGTACMVAGCSVFGCGNLDPFCCALNGCPDGVPDGCDVCPDDNVDADGDGTPDSCDGCPSDSSKILPGVCLANT